MLFKIRQDGSYDCNADIKADKTHLVFSAAGNATSVR